MTKIENSTDEPVMVENNAWAQLKSALSISSSTSMTKKMDEVPSSQTTKSWPILCQIGSFELSGTEALHDFLPASKCIYQFWSLKLITKDSKKSESKAALLVVAPLQP